MKTDAQTHRKILMVMVITDDLDTCSDSPEGSTVDANADVRSQMVIRMVTGLLMILTPVQTLLKDLQLTQTDVLTHRKIRMVMGLLMILIPVQTLLMEPQLMQTDALTHRKTRMVMVYLMM